MKAHVEQRIRDRDDTYSHSRTGPFEFADGVRLLDASGKVYIDFLSGDGSLNYGYREPTLRRALADYNRSGSGARGTGVGRDAGGHFVELFEQRILRQRGLDYRFRVTGTRATQALAESITIARRLTGRNTVITFTDTIADEPPGGRAIPPIDTDEPRVVAIPFSDAGDAVGERIEKTCGTRSDDARSPAAIVVECARYGGDLSPVSSKWMQAIATYSRRRGALLVVDETGTGCGRCSDFFAFERSGVVPDLVLVSRSLSGYGLPLSAVLVHSALKRSFAHCTRGLTRVTQHAFVTASAALERFWSDAVLTRDVLFKAELAHHALQTAAASPGLRATGAGLVRGIEFGEARTCASVVAQCRRDGLLVASSGPRASVLKIMPALTISGADLAAGLEVLREAIEKSLLVNNPARDGQASSGGQKRDRR